MDRIYTDFFYTYLEFSVVKLVAVLEKKLIRGSYTCSDTVSDHNRSPRGTCKLLYLREKVRSFTLLLL